MKTGDEVTKTWVWNEGYSCRHCDATPWNLAMSGCIREELGLPDCKNGIWKIKRD